MKKTTVGITSLLTTGVGAAGGYIISSFLKDKEKGEIEKKVDKYRNYYNVLNQWLTLKLQGKSLEKYFIEKKYFKIAIYGMGELGNRLYEELKSSQIKVEYAIDKQFDTTYAEIEVLSNDDALKEVDVIVVTSIFAFEEIEEKLHEKVSYPIVSIEDIVYDL